MIAIGESLKRQKSLQHLTLNFESCCQITDLGFGRINETLRELTSLETLDFNYYRSEHLSNRFCESLVANLENLTYSLKTINLNLLYCSLVSDKGLAHISEGIMKLPFLENIRLILYSELTDGCLINLAQSFKTLKSLKTLHISLQGCDKVTDIGLASLSESLKRASSLRRIYLDFGLCGGVTNVGLSSLSKCFQRLRRLDYIGLNLEGCSKITDGGLESLKETFEGNLLLREANLLFMGCTRITPQGFEGFVSSLKKTNSLKKLSLSSPFYDDDM